ncbi:MAG: hypothetical protein ACTSXD_13450 [Candidatus Heimdallarchaeaceae archaeon]
MKEEKFVQDYIMWIGRQFYPTPEHFIKEAERLGVCKRISFIPKEAIPHQTKLFLIHPIGERINVEKSDDKKHVCFHCGNNFYSDEFLYSFRDKFLCDNCANKIAKVKGTKYYPAVIGFCILDSYEVIVDDSNLSEFRKKIKDKNIKPISISQTKKEVRRGCGFRSHIGAIYFVSSRDLDEIEDLVKKLKLKHQIEIRGGFVKFKEFIPINLPFFRGIKKFNSENIGIERVKLSKKAKNRKWDKEITFIYSFRKKKEDDKKERLTTLLNF